LPPQRGCVSSGSSLKKSSQTDHAKLSLACILSSSSPYWAMCRILCIFVCLWLKDADDAHIAPCIKMELVFCSNGTEAGRCHRQVYRSRRPTSTNLYIVTRQGAKLRLQVPWTGVRNTPDVLPRGPT
jgi:hypothetical protein